MEGHLILAHLPAHLPQICDDEFDDNAATVACREMRLPTPGRAIGSALFGPGTGPIWLDSVVCTGAETSLQMCRRAPWGVTNCRHSEDVSVVCGSALIPGERSKCCSNPRRLRTTAF